jgi:hypothetical protein
LQAFSKEIELQAQEKAQEMEIVPKPWRQPIGRPQKQLQATSISGKEIKRRTLTMQKAPNHIKKDMMYLHKLVCPTSLASNICNSEKTLQSH